MTRYRLKPPLVTAFQWVPDDKKQAAKVCAWLVEHELKITVNAFAQIEVAMTDHSFLVDPHDWIVCGPHQEWFPVKPDVFNNTYEAL